MTPTAQPDWADSVDELDPQPSDIRILRQRWSTFGDTALHAELQRAGVTQVVLAPKSSASSSRPADRPAAV